MVHGGILEEHRIFPLKLDLHKSQSYSKSLSTSLWRKLDWWLMPEKSIMWTLAIALTVVLGGVVFNQFPQSPNGMVGFPNNLVISRGNVMVTFVPEKGLHLSNNSVNSAADSKDDLDKNNVKGAI